MEVSHSFDYTRAAAALDCATNTCSRRGTNDRCRANRHSYYEVTPRRDTSALLHKRTRSLVQPMDSSWAAAASADVSRAFESVDAQHDGFLNPFGKPGAQVTADNLELHEPPSVEPGSTSVRSTASDEEDSDDEKKDKPEEPVTQDSVSFAACFLFDHFVVSPNSTVSRSIVYELYQECCRKSNVKEIGCSFFGKVVKKTFPSVKFRRLGARGNSKYHYHGISPKESSPFVNVLNERVPLVRARPKHAPPPVRRSKSEDVTHGMEAMDVVDAEEEATPVLAPPLESAHVVSPIEHLELTDDIIAREYLIQNLPSSKIAAHLLRGCTLDTPDESSTRTSERMDTEMPSAMCTDPIMPPAATRSPDFFSLSLSADFVMNTSGGSDHNSSHERELLRAMLGDTHVPAVTVR